MTFCFVTYLIGEYIVEGDRSTLRQPDDRVRPLRIHAVMALLYVRAHWARRLPMSRFPILYKIVNLKYSSLITIFVFVDQQVNLVVF